MMVLDIGTGDSQTVIEFFGSRLAHRRVQVFEKKLILALGLVEDADFGVDGHGLVAQVVGVAQPDVAVHRRVHALLNRVQPLVVLL